VLWSLYISFVEQQNFYLCSVVPPASAGAYRRLKAGVSASAASFAIPVQAFRGDVFGHSFG
jgi:hypothetical protein